MISMIYVVVALVLMAACAFKANRMSVNTSPLFKAGLVLFSIGGSGGLYLLTSHYLQWQFKVVFIILSAGAALWLIHERRIR